MISLWSSSTSFSTVLVFERWFVVFQLALWSHLSLWCEALVVLDYQCFFWWSIPPEYPYCWSSFSTISACLRSSEQEGLLCWLLRACCKCHVSSSSRRLRLMTTSSQTPRAGSANRDIFSSPLSVLMLLWSGSSRCFFVVIWQRESQMLFV